MEKKKGYDMIENIKRGTELFPINWLKKKNVTRKTEIENYETRARGCIIKKSHGEKNIIPFYKLEIEKLEKNRN